MEHMDCYPELSPRSGFARVVADITVSVVLLPFPELILTDAAARALCLCNALHSRARSADVSVCFS
jgi:hypothetical protein